MKWPKDINGAKKVQEVLKKKVKIISLRKSPEYIAGVDAAFAGDKVIDVACLFKYPEITPVEEAYAKGGYGKTTADDNVRSCCLLKIHRQGR